MQELYKDKYPNMPYKRMNVLQMEYDAGTFDAVIDKGTFDSIQCGDGAGANTDQMLNEVYRVMSPNGVFICISQCHYSTRLEQFTRKDMDWVVTHEKVLKPFAKENSHNEDDYIWVYIMRKQGAAQ